MEYPYVVIDGDTSNLNTILMAFENQEQFIFVGAANNEQSGLDLILERMPVLVFLDIDMPGSYGSKTLYYLMNELRKYMDKLPEFVVLSRSVNYALDGIRNGVLDYILKPIEKKLIHRTLLRFRKESHIKNDTTICFKSYGDYKFINSNEVIYLKADNNATDFVMKNGSVVGAFKCLKYFQESLPNQFVRIHNSYIVNTDYISRIHFGKSKCTVKNTNFFIPFSKSYRSNVELIKNKLSKASMLIA